ncbi:uncharacterized protein [Dermacentor albipictus]|uniref:uncharacterized protein isoform X2 n=1 Tax=Dermacentor albipictus TaxID=60249 RepID=UPI0038FD0405
MTNPAEEFMVEWDRCIIPSQDKVASLNQLCNNSLKVMMVHEKHLLITVEDPHKFGHFSAAVDPIGLPATTVPSYYWIRRHLNLGGRSRTVVAAVSLPAVRMKQLHNRRSVASHQFPFSAIEDAFLPVLHPVTDHSNDLGRIVTQEEVRLAPSLV